MDFLELQELYHSGVKGMKWGVRRYQNEDGSLTAEGKARYGYNETTGKISKEGKKVEKSDIKEAKKEAKQFRKEYRKENHTAIKNLFLDDKNNTHSNMEKGKEYEMIAQKYGKKVASSLKREDYLKEAALVTSIATGVGLAVIGSYNFYKNAYGDF